MEQVISRRAETRFAATSILLGLLCDAIVRLAPETSVLGLGALEGLTMTDNTTITVAADSDADDCLSAAADAYVATHPALAGWDIAPRWASEARDAVLLDVPAWSIQAEAQVA